MKEPEIVICFSNGIRHVLKTVQTKINDKNGSLVSIKVVAPSDDAYNYGLSVRLSDDSCTSAILSANEGNVMRFNHIPIKGKTIVISWVYTHIKNKANFVWERQIQCV